MRVFAGGRCGIASPRPLGVPAGPDAWFHTAHAELWRRKLGTFNLLGEYAAETAREPLDQHVIAAECPDFGWALVPSSCAHNTLQFCQLMHGQHMSRAQTRGASSSS